MFPSYVSINNNNINNSNTKKQKLQPVMPSEQETGGQRKELPLVRWYGYTQMNGSVLPG